MNVAEIVELQNRYPQCLVMVRDRLFWQVWQESAYVFVHQIRPYKTHRRFYKNMGRELVYLGFPRTAMEDILQCASDHSWTIKEQQDHLIVLEGPWDDRGFADWCQTSSPDPADKIEKQLVLILPIYQVAYDFTLDLHRSTAQMSKQHKYGLGGKLLDAADELLCQLHILSNQEKSTPAQIAVISERFLSIRLWMRMLKDLGELPFKQYARFNQTLEELISQFQRWQGFV